MKDIVEIMNASQQIRKNARSVLDEMQLDHIVNQFGTIHFTGSYELDLMVWNDIDCQIRYPAGVDENRLFTQMAGILFNLKGVQKLQLINFEINLRQGMPCGYYCGFEYASKTLGQWKIDIWHLKENDFEKNKKFMGQIQSGLNDSTKENILRWKHRFMNNTARVPHLVSYYLYQAIIIEKLTSDSDILEFLSSNQIIIPE